MKNGPETYQILGSHEAVTVVANPDFPRANLQCQFTPCTYLSENAFDFAGQTFIVNWFDGETISVTGINDAGRPFVTVWDRCGLPQNIQDVFGTRIPPMKKDISRFFTNEFMKKYGAQPDSIRLHFLLRRLPAFMFGHQMPHLMRHHSRQLILILNKIH